MRVLALDAAFRETGLCLHDTESKDVLFLTPNFKGERDELLAWCIAYLKSRVSGVIDIALVEFPPPAVKKKVREKGKIVFQKYQGQILGFAAAMWAAACHIYGVKRVVTVDVGVWRGPILGTLGSEAKRMAQLRAAGELRRIGKEAPPNDHCAEAWCIGQWGIRCLPQ